MWITNEHIVIEWLFRLEIRRINDKSTNSKFIGNRIKNIRTKIKLMTNNWFCINYIILTEHKFEMFSLIYKTNIRR